MVSTDGLPLLLREGLNVVLVPPELKGPRSHVVSECGQIRGGQLVSFAGITTLGLASKLVGKTVLAKLADLPADFELHDAQAVVGREVQDIRLGTLGTVCDVIHGPAQDVWVVRGARAEVLIPVVDALVKEWHADSPIVVDLPPGLVEER